MKKLIAGVVYTALLMTANAGWADMPDIAALREGDMKKLVIHAAPKAVSDTAYTLADDAGEGRLSDYRGQYALVNFWATWCAPCRKEMPQLNALQQEFGGDDFQVVTIATGRNSPAGIVKFFAEAGVDSLPRHQDPRQALAAQMGIFGLPITVLIDPEGREIARLRGDAVWDSDSAKAIVKALIDDMNNS